MATEPQSPTPEEERPEATHAQQRVENATPTPEPTPLDALRQGSETWNQWRSDHPDALSLDLAGIDVAGLDLGGANLRAVKLQGATLSGVDLSGTDLREADLSKVRIVDQSNLTGASFQDANLRDADLGNTRGLDPVRLAGADLTGATLPEAGEEDRFDLGNVEEASRNARKLFLSMLLVCAYTVLTAATTTDSSLVTNSGTSPLPIIGSRIPIVEFYMVTPVLLLGFYIYFHLYSQRLWQRLGALPAIFPNGRRLDTAVYPWMLNGLVTAHRRRLRKDLPPFFWLQYWASTAAAWGVVPVTVLALWGSHLTRQDTAGSYWLAVVQLVCVGFGLSFYLTARTTLRGGQVRPRVEPRKKLDWAGAARGAALLAWGGLLAYSSNEAASGALFGFSFSANFERQEVSVKPPGWSWEDLRLVHGARLAGRNLRNLDAQSAFLARADLQEADLTEADLRDADLREANLEGAVLLFADLRGALVAEEIEGWGKGSLTDEQIQQAIGDAATVIPFEVATPRSHWREPRWVDVDGGELEMGCVEGDRNCEDNEKPRHRVVNGFEMRATEVTAGEYLKFAHDTNSEMLPQGSWTEPAHPVANVDWHQAQAYCEWAGGRLPTEAEWEYACRGGLQGSIYPWGNEQPDDTRAKSGSSDGTAPVGSYRPNKLGLYDMAGNVAEWTADWYGPYEQNEQVDPKGPAEGTHKALRGGSWNNVVPEDLRCSVRYDIQPDYWSYVIGFRCVREVIP